MIFVQKEFEVRVTVPKLNVRVAPGSDQEPKDILTPGNYFIVETAKGVGSAAGWGLLKRYAEERDGWVSLDCVQRV